MKNHLIVIFETLLCMVYLSSCSLNSNSTPNNITTDIYTTESTPKKIGTITAQDSAGGLLLTTHITPNSFLTPGIHGFHLHINPSCNHSGQDAGSHLDPHNRHSHKGPYKDGHLGDLPALYAEKDGSITESVIAPNLRLKDIYNHSYMIHQGGDNYSDMPLPLGGGGARKACGAIATKIIKF